MEDGSNGITHQILPPLAGGVEGQSTARDLCRMNLFNFGSLTGVSGSASAERRFQPQKGYNPSPGSFTHSSIFARLPNFPLDTEAFSQFRRNELLVL
jgi:hypothetical protein